MSSPATAVPRAPRLLALRRVSAGTLVAAGLVAVVCAVPVAYLFVVILDEPAVAWDVIWRADTLSLLLRSLALAVAVGATATLVAVPLAWLTSRSDLPWRRGWTILSVLPLVIPSYIGAYLFVSALGPRGELQGLLGVERLPSVYGFGGAWIVLTLFTFPLVLLPVRAALRRLDPNLEEAAAGMGRSQATIARTVILPQLVPAIGAGALLVSLYALADFGAVSILRFDSFTRVIYQSYRASFDRTGAAALAGVLVIVMLLLLVAESRLRRRRSYHRVGPGSIRAARPVPLGRWRWPALAYCATVAFFSFLLPVGMLVYWSAQSVAGSTDWQQVLTAAANSFLLAALTALVAAVAALPVAWLGARAPGRLSRLVDTLTTSGYALPGIVVALAVVFVGIRLVPFLYQTLPMTVIAMVIVCLPLAITATRAAVLQLPPRLEEAARGSGRSPAQVLATIGIPLTRAGILAGAALVFVAAIKELPVVVLLSPIGFSTLPLVIWQESTRAFFESGAIPALVLLLVTAPGVWLLVGRER
ncbi:MAG: ABC transporter permease [Solirubrobacterales bacterium]